MGYSKGIKWSEELIKNEILGIIKVLDIDRMPTSVEIKKITKNYSLCCAIQRYGGFRFWANKLNLNQNLCTTRIGYDGENKILNMLTGIGYKVIKMPLKHPYDLLVNGLVKLDVKLSNKYISNKGWSSYSFNLEKNYPTCDIYVLVCNDSGKILVIPSKFLTQNQVCITDKECKYDKFINRFDYIEDYLNFYNKIN